MQTPTSVAGEAGAAEAEGELESGVESEFESGLESEFESESEAEFPRGFEWESAEEMGVEAAANFAPASRLSKGDGARASGLAGLRIIDPQSGDFFTNPPNAAIKSSATGIESASFANPHAKLAALYSSP